jgi:hypothetical protein
VRELEDAPSTYFAQATGSMSCGGGTSEGSGVLHIGGRKIRFSFSEVRGPGVAAVSLQGRAGGSATGAAHVSADESPADIAAKCSGEGLSSAPIDINLETTPAISG